MHQPKSRNIAVANNSSQSVQLKPTNPRETNSSEDKEDSLHNKNTEIIKSFADNNAVNNNLPNVSNPVSQMQVTANENFEKSSETELSDELQQHSVFQKKDNQKLGEISQNFQDKVSKATPVQMRTSNKSMPGEVKDKMEASFNADFSDVQIGESKQVENMGALAYAQGNQINFAPGQFKPNSQSGQELLGHELTHIIQQRNGRVKPTRNVGGMPVNDNAGLEREADMLGKKAASSKPDSLGASSTQTNNNTSSSTSQMKLSPSTNQAVQLKSLTRPGSLYHFYHSTRIKEKEQTNELKTIGSKIEAYELAVKDVKRKFNKENVDNLIDMLDEIEKSIEDYTMKLGSSPTPDDETRERVEKLEDYLAREPIEVEREALRKKIGEGKAPETPEKIDPEKTAGANNDMLQQLMQMMLSMGINQQQAPAIAQNITVNNDINITNQNITNVIEEHTDVKPKEEVPFKTIHATYPVNVPKPNNLPEVRADIEELAIWLRANPDKTVTFAGNVYNGNPGKDWHNGFLGNLATGRAKNVRDLLYEANPSLNGRVNTKIGNAYPTAEEGLTIMVYID